MSTSDDSSIAFERALLSLDRRLARRVLTDATGALTPIQMAERVMASALQRIGVAWESGDLALSQVYMSGRICEELLQEIIPAAQEPDPTAAKVAVAVLGDYHVLGKRMVCMALRAAGINYLDYGHGLEPRDLAKKAVDDGIEILLISVLLLPSALSVATVHAALREADSSCRVIVGGAPFNLDHSLWKETGADAVGTCASDAPGIVRSMLEGGDQ